MREIPLRGKYSHLSIIVDDEDFEMLNKYYWHGSINHGGPEVRANGILKGIGGKGRKIPVGRIVLGIDDDPSIQADHINLNCLDNRRCNLRIATNSQNNANKGKQKSAIYSEYKGVSWDKRRGKWYSQISKNNKCKFLGYFNDEVKAAKAYDIAAKRLYGEYAFLNFQ